MMSTGGYLIRRDPAGSFVEAWSAWHLPFEPRLTPQLEYRARLRDAIARLGASEALTATYISPNWVQGLDVENVLFYNVGTSVFRNVAKRAVRFARISTQPPAPPLVLEFEAKHYVRYETLTREARFDTDANQPAVAQAHIALRDIGEMKSLAILWQSFKGAMAPGARMESLIGKPFEVRLVISAPARCQPKLVEVMKPLLDAFISALHFYQGAQLDAVTARVSARLAIAPDHVRSLLLHAETAVLGPRAVPYLRGDGLQWSPADDLLVAGELRLETVEADGAIEMGGAVLASN